MRGERHPYTFDRVVRILITAGVLFALIWLLHYLSDVLIPFAVAFLLAYLMNPLVLRIQRKVRNCMVSVFVSLSLVIGLAVLIGLLIVPAVAREISDMGRSILSNLAQRSCWLTPLPSARCWARNIIF